MMSSAPRIARGCDGNKDRDKVIIAPQEDSPFPFLAAPVRRYNGATSEMSARKIVNERRERQSVGTSLISSVTRGFLVNRARVPAATEG